MDSCLSIVAGDLLPAAGRCTGRHKRSDGPAALATFCKQGVRRAAGQGRLGHHSGVSRHRANAKADVAVLRDFLALLPEISRRHSVFATNRRSLRRSIRVLHDTQCDVVRCRNRRKLKTRKSAPPAILLPLSAAQLFARGFEEAGGARLGKCIADGLETYAFFKHEEDPRSPHNAVELLHAVRSKVKHS